MDDKALSDRIARASVDAGIHPWDGDLPEGLPFPALQVYCALRFPPGEADPMETWLITVMLEQQVGSMSYWIPATLRGPNQPLQRHDDPDPDYGWRMSFTAQPHAYPDLQDMSRGWWPSLEHWWWDVPDRYKRYDPFWRSQSDCMHCACTGIVMHNLEIRLPCPHCRSTPAQATYGWNDLMWLPAHTLERRRHAHEGARWRWQGAAYVVETVLGRPQDPHDDVWVGLQPVVAPHSLYRRFHVGPGWADHDIDSERAFVVDPGPPTPGILRRFHRRVLGWFDHGLIDG